MADHEDARRLPARRTTPLAIVNWWYPDDSVVSGCPMDYEAAEALMHAYQRRYPERRSWLSVPAALEEPH